MKTIQLLTIACGLWAINVTNLHAGTYISGNLGAITRKPTESTRQTKSLYGATLGYSFPVLLKTEIFYKNCTDHMIGAAARLSPIPLLSLNLGLYRVLINDNKYVSDTNGVFFGPGINFNWLPIIDIFGDLSIHRIRSTTYTSAELGLRIHF